MRLIKDLKELEGSEKKQLFGITLGNFDGLHLGHSEFIRFMLNDCEKNNLLPIVATFVPHPKLALSNVQHFLINDYVERRDLLSKMGIKYLYEIEFSKNLSLMDSTEFLDKYLFMRKDIVKIYLGHDFSFGKGKSFGPEIIKKYCLAHKIEYHFQDQYTFSGHDVSSSKVRESLSCGDIETTNKLLGRSYFIAGSVVKGFGRGKKIGFSTANLDISNFKIIPKNGVYVTQVEIGNNKFKSLTNIGNNPTFNSNSFSVETHILEFNENLYDKNLKIFFLKRIRDEIRFETVADLKDQIQKDISYAKDFFKK